MKATTALGRMIKPFVNVSRWMGLAQLKANAVAIKKMIQDLRIHRPPVRQETFEEAMQRMNLTEEILKSRIKTCLWLSILYTVAAIVLLTYSIYMIVHGQLGMIIGILLTGLMMVFAYREHFWYFQMKTRKLGNTFRDWVSYILRRGERQ